MREIKFRVWDKYEEKMLSWEDIRLKFSLNALRASGIDFVFMQFTGLLDSNEKEIYEGDILKFDEGIIDGRQTEFGRMVVRFGEYNTYEIESGDEAIGWFVEGYRGYRRDNGKVDIHKTEDREGHPESLLSCIKRDTYDVAWEVIGNIYENPALIKDCNV